MQQAVNTLVTSSGEADDAKNLVWMIAFRYLKSGICQHMLSKHPNQLLTVAQNIQDVAAFFHSRLN